MTGEVHKVNTILLQDLVIKALEIDVENFLSLYKLIGSGNTFFLELEPDTPCPWQNTDIRLDNGLYLTIEDTRAPRTHIKLESVPYGTSDATITNYFKKHLIKSAKADDIKVIQTRNNRGDERLVVLPLDPQAKVPDYIRFENKEENYTQTCIVILPGGNKTGAARLHPEP